MSNDERLKQIVKEISEKGDVRATLKNSTYSNIFAEGRTVYSYGYHYIAGVKVGSVWLINSNGYSMSTQRHVSKLYAALRSYGVDADSIISAPIATTYSQGIDMNTTTRNLTAEILDDEKALLRTRKGSGRNLHITRMVADKKLALRRLVLLDEMNRDTAGISMIRKVVNG